MAEKQKIVQKNSAYCQDRGIKFNNTFLRIPENKEQKMSDQDKKVYDELVEAMIFL